MNTRECMIEGSRKRRNAQSVEVIAYALCLKRKTEGFTANTTVEVTCEAVKRSFSRSLAGRSGAKLSSKKEIIDRRR